MVRICVSDSGPGLPPEIAERLFEPFQTTKEEGLGVGLSISRTIVEAHGGSIQAGNASGGGCSVCFTLPVHAGAPTGAAAPPPAQ